MTSTCRTIVVTAAALALLGCAEERPTRPVPMAEFPAMSLSDVLMYETSQSVESVPGVKDSVTLCFSDEPLFTEGRVDDIIVYLESDLQLQTDGLFVLKPASGENEVIHGALPGLSGVCQMKCPDWAIKLLSQIPSSQPHEFLDNYGCLRLTATNAWNFKTRLVDYNPSYTFITARTQEVFWGGGSNNLTVVNDTVWHYHSVWDSISESLVDSLIGYLRDGSRAYVGGFRNGITDGAAFDGSRFWVLTQDGSIAVFDREGSYAGGFDYPTPGSYPSLLTWTLGHLWIGRPIGFAFDPPQFIMDQLDADSSLGSGAAVIQRTIELPYRQIQGFQLTATHTLICSANPTNNALSDLRMLDSTLAEISYRPFPVAQIESMALDDTTIWVLHHGALGAHTDATLLSRFTLE